MPNILRGGDIIKQVESSGEITYQVKVSTLIWCLGNGIPAENIANVIYGGEVNEVALDAFFDAIAENEGGEMLLYEFYRVTQAR